MKNYIYYFTGTGNSLYVAKTLAERIDNAELVDISTCYDQPTNIGDVERIGIVVPVYVFGAPLLVETFIKNLVIKSHQYLYVVLVHGGSPYSAVESLKKKIETYGYNLDAGFEVIAPDNYLAELNPPTKEEALKILESTDEEIEQALSYISNKSVFFPKVKFWKKWMGLALQPTFKSYAAKAPTKFTVTDQCNGCSICEKACPKSVVKLTDSKSPVWSKDGCEMCFACINLCPQGAIEYGKKTLGRNRYMNPKLNLKDLINS